MSDKVSVNVVTIKDLLTGQLGRETVAATLNIPNYQRPYKWSRRSVEQLLEDIVTFRDQSRYRIGTIILHKRSNSNDSSYVYDIVDGQQRYLTFALIARALYENGVDSVDVSENLKLPKDKVTASNLRSNYNFIKNAAQLNREGADGTSFTDFFFNKCELVILTLTSLDEAFQMFDSQNSRGKELDPTDLLKAFHLREMNDASPQARIDAVGLWKSFTPQNRSRLFREYLYKIKQWSNGQSSFQPFSNAHLDLFKGIREGNKNNVKQPWAELLIYARQMPEFPFQIDHPVINGEMFFKMFHHYAQLALQLGVFSDANYGSREDTLETDHARHPMLKTFREEQSKQNLSRDSRFYWTITLFDCLLLYYVDRFGEQQMERALDLFLNRSFAPRIVRRRLLDKTVDRYVLGEKIHNDSELAPNENLFYELRRVTSANDFLRRNLTTYDHIDSNYADYYREIRSAMSKSGSVLENRDEQALDNSGIR